MFDYERLEALSIEGEAPQSEPETVLFYEKVQAVGRGRERANRTSSYHVNSDARLSDECKGLGEDDSNS